MAEEIKAQVEEIDDGLSIVLRGPAAKRLDRKMVQECAQSVFACARSNDCFEGGFTLTRDCVQTVAGHDKDIACIERGFGLAAAQRG